MRLPKKLSRRKNPSGLNESGLDERRALLAKNGFPESFLTSRFGTTAQCGWDDQLDACAAAWTAERILNGTSRRIPEASDWDEMKLDMAIWA
jgi:predicted RNase H-like nuclease